MELNLTAAVLCGGQSRRFGRAKEWLDFGGRPLLEHIVETIRPHFQRVLAVGLRPDAPTLRDVHIVPDAVAGAGPLGGILTALSAVRTEYTFCFACDAPFINPSLVRAMQTLAPGADAVVPKSGPHFQPLFAIYSRNCIATAREQLLAGYHKISSIFSHLNVHWVDEAFQQRHDPDLLSFININTPADYAGALDILARASGRDGAAVPDFSITNL